VCVYYVCVCVCVCVCGLCNQMPQTGQEQQKVTQTFQRRTPQKYHWLHGAELSHMINDFVYNADRSGSTDDSLLQCDIML